MNYAQSNIAALQKNTYFSDQVLDVINGRKNPQINTKFVQMVLKIPKTNTVSELTNVDFTTHVNYVVFGLFDLQLVKKLIQEMTSLSTLTIFEKDVDLLVYQFGTEDISSILADPRVVLLAGDKDSMRKYITIRVSIREFSYNLPRIKIICSNYMRKLNQSYIDDLTHYLIDQSKYIASSLGNDINDMLEGFDHSIENWPNLDKSIGVNDLKNKFKDVPAIIVSAGPSLDKNIESLKGAVGKALILTVDTTLKKVLDLGIVPDSVSTIERPDNMYSIFYEGIDIPKETSFIGPSVVTKKIIDEFERFIFTGRRGEPTVKAIADTLGYESLEIGLSCAHIPFAFAEYVGANPIIFIGQDLAFSNEGHTHFGEASKITQEGAKKQELVEVVGNNGEKLLTNKFYYQFLLWFQNQIAQISGRTVINATEGGARIEGTVSMKFEDVIKKYCKNNVKHLSEAYDEIRSNSNLDNEDKLELVGEFLKDLIYASEQIGKRVNDYKQTLIKMQEDTRENIDHFYQMRKQLDLDLNQNYVLNFLFQTITLKYNRAFNNFPSSMGIDNWKKLKFEGVRYYTLVQQVCEALTMKFNQYLQSIEKTKDRNVL